MIPPTNNFTVTVVKDSKHQMCGISLRGGEKESDPITVSVIKEDGLFGNTDLRVGMEVESINNTKLEDKTKPEAVEMLKTAEGQVTVVAKAVVGGAVAIVKKPSSGQDCGIVFGQASPARPVVIGRIAPDSIFANTPLKVGMRVVSVNRTSVEGLTKAEVTKAIKAATGVVTIVTRPPPPVVKMAVYPPPGVPTGGVWGQSKYIGEETAVLTIVGCICCGLPGCLMGCCADDSIKAYKLGDKVSVLSRQRSTVVLLLT